MLKRISLLLVAGCVLSSAATASLTTTQAIGAGLGVDSHQLQALFVLSVKQVDGGALSGFFKLAPAASQAVAYEYDLTDMSKTSWSVNGNVITITGRMTQNVTALNNRRQTVTTPYPGSSTLTLTISPVSPSLDKVVIHFQPDKPTMVNKVFDYDGRLVAGGVIVQTYTLP